MVGVAQLVSASDCGSEARRFEPHYPPWYRYFSDTFFSNLGLSPSGKAPDFDSGTRWFESS